MSDEIVITALPKSWWATYTEALLGSRGLKTEFKQWRERMDLQSRFLRDVEQAWFEHYSTSRVATRPAASGWGAP